MKKNECIETDITTVISLGSQRHRNNDNDNNNKRLIWCLVVAENKCDAEKNQCLFNSEPSHVRI